MKHSTKYLAIFLLILISSGAFGQSNFKETVGSFNVDPPQTGSDFWFAPAMNEGSVVGKSIRLYITSSNNTTAFVESEGTVKAFPISAGGIGVFNVALAWEMQSSGIVENKGIHVYDPTDEITVYLMSSSTDQGEGMYCIPLIGLGTDYVVAGYESYATQFGAEFDYPSEFTITANQDSTIVEITPSCDLRQGNIFPGNANTIAFPKGRQFEVTLDQGQAVQYQALLADGGEGYDVTGTIIHSNNTVGVVGGSMLSNIPAEFPFANYLCDMIPPTRAWGKTYYTTNNIQLPDTLPSHDSSLYCLVSSVPNQVIYRHDCADGNHVVDTLGPTFDHYYAEESGANKWYSDQPFMLVQYFNSNTYPDGKTGSGSPAEVVIYPRESFTKTVQFLTPTGAGAQSPSDNYANIIVNINDTNNVKLNNKSILSFAHFCLDDTFEMYVAPHLAGAYSLTSDSGCTADVYGYSDYQTFSWSGSHFAKTYNPNDTILPAISFTNGALCAHAIISDSGAGLAEIILDTMVNLSFTVDTAFVPGSGVTTTFADFCADDSARTGFLQFTAYDLAGNGAIGMITFTPSPKAGVTDQSQTTIYATLTPNPAANSATLNFTLPQTADVTFELSSMDGKTVFRWKADAESEGEHVQTLDISSLADGDYIYRFESNGESTSGKLAILR